MQFPLPHSNPQKKSTKSITSNFNTTSNIQNHCKFTKQQTQTHTDIECNPRAAIHAAFEPISTAATLREQSNRKKLHKNLIFFQKT